MSDLINRAETLEAIKRYFRKAIDEIDGEAGFEYISDACEAILKYTVDICKMIEALPSAEPKQPDFGPISCISAEKMHDRTTDGLISRQDAIEEIARRDTTDGTIKVFSGKEVAEILNSLPSAEPEWNNHTVACLLAEMFGENCACNFNGIDEWLPEKCELIDVCPHPVGVACWEQFLKHRAERRTDGSD